MTIKMFCPKWYYLGTVPTKNQKRIRSIFSDFISDDSNYLTPSGWQCNVLSTYSHDNNPNAPWDEFANEIEPCMIEFLKEMYPKKEPLMSPTEAWVNKYKKGGFQENHDHVLSPNHEHFCNLSFIYFYQVNDSNFEFYNREYSEYIKSGLDDVFRVSVERFTSPQVKTGDVIIFPSTHEHRVTRNMSDDERITISMNFCVT